MKWQNIPKTELNQLNILALAYLGDAVYDLYIRRRLVCGDTNVNTLHNRAIGFVSAKGQAFSLDAVLNCLDEDELNVYRRGRNGRPSSVPRNATAAEYKKATGLEAIFGFLYLEGEEGRLEELMELCFEAIERTMLI